MSILTSPDDRVIIQGISGQAGRRQICVFEDIGQPVVAGVAPGRGGQTIDGVPVYDTVAEAVAERGATSSVIHVPPSGGAAAHALVEAAEAGIRTAAVITEGLQVRDTVRAVQRARALGCRVIGPNGIGLISPGESLLGMMPPRISSPGPVGLLSRSGSLVLEGLRALESVGLGQSTAVSMGGDPVVGTSTSEYLALFEEDPRTGAVLLLTEIGGTLDAAASDVIATMDTPVVVLVVGRTAPPGTRMGHLGAIIDRASTSVDSKEARFAEVGAHVVTTLWDAPAQVRKVLA